MNQTLDAATVIAELRALADKLAGGGATHGQEPTAPPRTFMTMTEYATFRAVSITTVKKWVRLGMPHSKVGVRAVRVHVENANKWIAAGGATGAAIRTARGAA